jgi:hypothetical protein
VENLPSKLAMQIAAQVWTRPETEKIEMDSVLATEFAKVIDRYIDALRWASAASEFQDDGKSRKGWLTVCKPLIDEDEECRQSDRFLEACEQIFIDLSWFQKAPDDSCSLIALTPFGAYCIEPAYPANRSMYSDGTYIENTNTNFNLLFRGEKIFISNDVDGCKAWAGNHWNSLMIQACKTA